MDSGIGSGFDKKGKPVREEDLALRAAGGDVGAFELLCQRNISLLRRAAARNLSGGLRRKVAESDVIQETWITVYARLSTFEDRGPGSFKAWLRRILELKILDQVHRYVDTGKRDVRREESRPAGAPAPERATSTPDPGERLIDSETRDRIETAMASLPSDYQAVLELIHTEQLDARQAAARLQRSVAATRKLYGRALARLAKAVSDGDVR